MNLFPSPAAGLAEGERRKTAAHAWLSARRAALVRRGQRALLETLLRTREATTDAVRAAVPLPFGLNPKLFGAVPGPLVAAGLIRAAGFARTARPEAHARPLRVWALVDSVSAAAWLAANPELSEPSADAPVQSSLFE